MDNIMKIRVLFIDAKDPFSEGENRLRPLWPAYLSAYVEKNYPKKNRFSFHFARKLNVKKEMVAFQPDIVAISSVTQNYTYALSLSRAAKGLGASVILGGSHISAAPETLGADIDAGVLGEGEITFLELLESFSRRRALKPDNLLKINGLVINYQGKPHKTEPRPNISDLRELPMPKRSLIGYSRRSYIVTARGCNHRCIFCAASRHWNKLRFFPIERCLAEIDELVQNGVKVIRINDDNFAASTNRLRQLSQAIRSRGYHKRVKFSCWARANDLNGKKVALLKSMNIVSVVMGLESMNQASLDFLKGHVTVDDNLCAVALLKTAGIQTNADFIIGSPKETREQILATYNYIKNSPIDFVTVNILTPMPGTPLWDLAKKQGLVDDSDYVGKYSFNYKFGAFPKSNITISEYLTTEELYVLYRRFLWLEYLKTFRALPRTPWKDELPKVFAKRIFGFAMRCYQKIFNSL